MRHKNWYGLLLIIGLIVAASCGDNPTCVDTETNLVKVNFVDSLGKAKEVFLNSLKAIDNEDGFPEYANDTLTNISLPLNPGATTTTFILEQENTDTLALAITDTLALSYNVEAKLISPECGLDAAFSKLDTVFTTFNKLRILSSTIHESVIVNIEVTL